MKRTELFFRIFNDGLVEQIDKPRIRMAKSMTEVRTPMGRYHQGMQQQQQSFANVVLGLQAAGYLDSDATTPIWRRQRGFASTAIVRNSAGNLTIATDEAISTAADGDVLASLTVNSAALACAAIELLSASTIRVLTAAVTVVPAVTAADLDFWITLSQFGPN